VQGSNHNHLNGEASFSLKESDVPPVSPLQTNCESNDERALLSARVRPFGGKINWAEIAHCRANSVAVLIAMSALER
jgi:hypothetical protein